MKRHLLALGSAFTLSAAALAQPPGNPVGTPPPPPPTSPPPAAVQPGVQPGGALRADSTAPARSFRVKSILGTRMNIQGNVSIGTVDDMVFNDDGYIEYLIVQNEGKLVTVPWQAAQFNFEARTATVNITREVFQTIPTYTTTSYPTFYAPAYRTELYRFYGLTPGQDRRLDRQQDRRDDRRNDRRP